MYLFTVGVILDIESDNDNESDKPLIVCLTLASVSPREIESLNALNFADSLDNESLVEIVSDKISDDIIKFYRDNKYPK